jgi:hypothetical protein
VVRKYDHYGIIRVHEDGTLTQVLDDIYDKILELSNNAAIVCKDGEVFVIRKVADGNREKIFFNGYDEILQYGTG